MNPPKPMILLATAALALVNLGVSIAAENWPNFWSQLVILTCIWAACHWRAAYYKLSAEGAAQ